MSGLGERRKLNAAAVDERYRNTCLVAKTRSVISLGVSTFTWTQPSSSESSSVSSWRYKVKTYNFLVLCSEDYIVEPGSLQFLVQHGFDFSAQYSLGIGYNRGKLSSIQNNHSQFHDVSGNDPEDCGETKQKNPQYLREIFNMMVSARRPVVLHNGLVDLVFLYHNFWAALPPKLDTFISDVGELFPAGVYDTKYIADYVARTQASYLEFVFKKELRNNVEKWSKDRPHVRVVMEEYDDDDKDVDMRYVGGAGDGDDGEVCPSYADHGHCPESDQCSLSHDIDQIVQVKTAEQDKKWRKRKVENTDDTVAVPKKVSKVDTNDKDAGDKKVKSGGHRAGYDAFMTGFSFSTFLVHHTQLPRIISSWSSDVIKTEKIVNRIYLVSKDFPLLLQKSSFAKCSVQHDLKMKRLGLQSDQVKP